MEKPEKSKSNWLLWIAIIILLLIIISLANRLTDLEDKIQDLENDIQPSSINDIQPSSTSISSSELTDLWTQVDYQNQYLETLASKLHTQEIRSSWYIEIPPYYPPL